MKSKNQTAQHKADNMVYVVLSSQTNLLTSLSADEESGQKLATFIHALREKLIEMYKADV